MRGRKDRQPGLFYSINLKSLVPADHPLRGIKKLADEELARLSPKFSAAYSSIGRPSIPPEALIKATLLQVLYSIRSERKLCEEIGYNLLFRWFLDLAPDAPVWDPTTFTQNRERFAKHGLMAAFFDGTVARGIQKEAVSDEHFSVDGTLVQSLASLKSFKPKDEDKSDPPDGNGWADFKGEKRSNATHESKTDPEARLFKKSGGKEALLCHSLHGLMENRNALLVDIEVSEANGRSERQAVITMLKHVKHRHWITPRTLGEDAGDRGVEHAQELEQLGVTQHIAGIKGRKPRGWLASQRVRRGIEKIFGWLKTVGGLRRTRFVERWKTKLYAQAAAATYNLMRLNNLGLAA